MALTLSSQGLVTGSFAPGTFTAGFAYNASTTTYYSVAALLTAAGTLFDPATLMPSSGGTVGITGPVAVTGTFFPSTQPVSGTFWQTTQPISAAALPLPSGAALESGGNLATIASAALGPIPAGSLSTTIGSVGINQTGTANNVLVTNLPTVTPASTNSIAANTAIAAHISAVAGQYGYVSTITISGLGATAASVIQCTLTGCIGGTYTFWINVPALPLALQPVQIVFNPPKQSSAVNTQIQCNVPAFGSGNTNASVMVDGYTSTSASPLP